MVSGDLPQVYLYWIPANKLAVPCLIYNERCLRELLLTCCHTWSCSKSLSASTGGSKEALFLSSADGKHDLITPSSTHAEPHPAAHMQNQSYFDRIKQQIALAVCC